MLPREEKSLGRGALPLHFPEEGPGAAALLLCTGCTSPGRWVWLWCAMATFRVGWALPRDYRETGSSYLVLGGMCGEREVLMGHRGAFSLGQAGECRLLAPSLVDSSSENLLCEF